MVRRTVFVPLIQVAKSLGLPRDWLIRQITDGHIPHLQIGREIYLHYETVVDTVVEMMKLNVVDAGMNLPDSNLNRPGAAFSVRGAAPLNFDAARSAGG
jgi:hypothetical protein